ncbi:MAG: TetR/AcrR family transcriptional regulator [Deltaproteobacteria bacterium]|nr:TetR/AcrR family transcriptional regulator [Deltaproteobacteria bacterium]
MLTWTPLRLARARKGDRTRERLLQAALEEFRAVGFEQASVGPIAARAGTSRASFYFHFPCKEAVLLDLQWRVEQSVIERTQTQRSLRAFLIALVDALIAEEERFECEDLMRDMLAVYIRRPAGLDLADQPFPLMMEVGRRFAAARETELRAGLDPAQATHLFLMALFGAFVGLPGPFSLRRDDLLQLASLFLAEPIPRDPSES